MKRLNELLKIRSASAGGDYFGGFSLCEQLEQVSRLEYAVTKKYNLEHAMTRYFRYIYMTPKAFLKLVKEDDLSEYGYADGQIVCLVSQEKIDPKVISRHMKTLYKENMVVIIPDRPFTQEENVKKLFQIRALKEDGDLMEKEAVLMAELEQYEELLYVQINQALEQDFMPERGKSRVAYLGGQRKGFYTEAAFHRYLSAILERYYDFTPIVNYELLNIHNVTGKCLKARNQVVGAILKKEDCTGFLEGVSREAMIFRAVFIQTGILSQDYPEDAGCAALLREMDAYFTECTREARSFSLLYKKLQGRHYGIRRGIIPLFLAKKLSETERPAVIRQGSKELAVNEELLNRVNEHPEKYQLYIEPKPDEKEENRDSDLLKGMINEAIYKVGESLKTDQKVEVLVSAIKELLE